MFRLILSIGFGLIIAIGIVVSIKNAIDGFKELSYGQKWFMGIFWCVIIAGVIYSKSNFY